MHIIQINWSIVEIIVYRVSVCVLVLNYNRNIHLWHDKYSIKWKTNHENGKQMNAANFDSNEKESEGEIKSKLYLIDWTFIIYRNRLWVICIFDTHTLTHMHTHALSYGYKLFCSKLPNAKVDLLYFQNETNKSTTPAAAAATLYTHKLYIIKYTHRCARACTRACALKRTLYLHKLIFFNRPGLQMNSIWTAFL